jgi:hypothetical protein
VERCSAEPAGHDTRRGPRPRQARRASRHRGRRAGRAHPPRSDRTGLSGGWGADRRRLTTRARPPRPGSTAYLLLGATRARRRRVVGCRPVPVCRPRRRERARRCARPVRPRHRQRGHRAPTRRGRLVAGLPNEPAGGRAGRGTDPGRVGGGIRDGRRGQDGSGAGGGFPPRAGGDRTLVAVPIAAAVGAGGDELRVAVGAGDRLAAGAGALQQRRADRGERRGSRHLAGRPRARISWGRRRARRRRTLDGRAGRAARARARGSRVDARRAGGRHHRQPAGGRAAGAVRSAR